MRCESGVHFSVPMNGPGGTECSYEITLPAAPMDELCPLDHFRGDAEFAGHGPDILVSASLEADGSQVFADVVYQAVESVPGETAVRGTRRHRLFRVGGSYASRLEVDAILSATPFREETRTSGTGFHELVTPEDERPVVANLVVVGDTHGTDIPNNAERCDDETHIVGIGFRPVRVRVRPASP
jgi:hypothetical protein